MLSAGAGAVPNTLTTVSPDFEVAYNWQNNLQLERQLGDRFAASVGVSYSRGYNLPVISNINLINPIGQLADGRNIYSTADQRHARASTRATTWSTRCESIGDSTYKNLTAQLTGRNVWGMQFDFAYTLGKSEDNAPITNVLSVQGDPGRADPDNLDYDLGPNVLDQRHTFSGSIVARPHIDGGNGIVRGDRQRHHPRPGDAVRQRRADQPALARPS